MLLVIGSPSSSLLEIEITESLFINDVVKNVAREKLVALRKAGLTVASDDFGTGYSSLIFFFGPPANRYAQDLPVVYRRYDEQS